MLNRYDAIDKKEALKILEASEIILKKDSISGGEDGEDFIVSSCYSTKQQFGATDYQDHRKDTKKQLLKLIKKNFASCSQRLHFYKDYNCEIPLNKFVVEGYYGGYTGYFID